MRLRNEIFAKVLDWLIKERKVVNQKDLALKTGITQTTISRIMKGKVEPEDETLRKLNNAFDNIFNLYSGRLFSKEGGFTLTLNDTWIQDYTGEW